MLFLLLPKHTGQDTGTSTVRENNPHVIIYDLLYRYSIFREGMIQNKGDNKVIRVKGICKFDVNEID